ncbi:hypothetical protein RBSH_03741 [Rhodopirellula baltica SH28]|uniref:Uncharacterized protein n=2 Tax=Rhodopirellula baltica TaxID=265606 RepID=F2AYZ1_RHOBT|nr:hypothetical protein RBWH47_04668 [Rhodopirellula baltica WH47]EKK01067.1 hypothetical protein RBSH_03741 [Rhodopirellula baltica SH28]
MRRTWKRRPLLRSGGIRTGSAKKCVHHANFADTPANDLPAFADAE